MRDGLDLVEEARPAFELALRWLHEHRPAPGPVRVVHGDFRIGNLLVDETGLQAVLDWELATLGDPLEDLGWVCVRAWRFGGEGEVGGVGPSEDLLDAYESGRPDLGSIEVTHHITEACLAVAESHRLQQRITLPLTNRSLYLFHV